MKNTKIQPRERIEGRRPTPEMIAARHAVVDNLTDSKGVIRCIVTKTDNLTPSQRVWKARRARWAAYRASQHPSFNTWMLMQAHPPERD